MILEFQSANDDSYFCLNTNRIVAMHHGYVVQVVGTWNHDGSDKRMVFHKAGTTRIMMSPEESDMGYEVKGNLDDIADWINREERKP